jgi:hypothetical protein
MVACLLLLITGCDSSPQSILPPEGEAGVAEFNSAGAGTAETSPADDPAPGADASQSKMTPVERPAVPKRETFTGNWLLTTLQVIPPQTEGSPPIIGEQSPLLLIVESKTDDDGNTSPSLRVGAGRGGFEAIENLSATIADDRVSFSSTNEEGQTAFEFDGRFEDGLVVGCFAGLGVLPRLARLLPTEERTFLRIPGIVPLPEVEEFKKLTESPIPEVDLMDFVERHPASPLVPVAYQQVLGIKASKGATEEELLKVIDAFVARQSKWSERLGLLAQFESMNAIAPRYPLEWTIKRSSVVEEMVRQDPLLQVLVQQCEIRRQQTEFNLTMSLLDSKKKEDRVRGRKLAAEALQRAPHDPLLTMKLADDARENENLDEAIRLYGELTAFPLQEKFLQQLWASDPIQRILPGVRLEEVWKAKHGSTDGLKDYLRKVYDEELYDFVESPVDLRPEGGNKVVLYELFTGARCGPCVGPNLALNGIERTYPRSMVIGLRYHMHIPGHDPLTNEDNEARFHNFYRANGTPQLYVNGRTVANAGGSVPMAKSLYRDFRTLSDEILAQKTDVAIDLKVTQQDGVVQVSAAVTGTDPENKQLRLRVLLVESGIEFDAANELRRHDMVVRKMLGGDRGTAQTVDGFTYSGSVKIEELRDELHSYLTRFERNQGVEFGRMPLDLENLSVVAFVQDDSTREVLQSVITLVQAGTTAEQVQ